MIFLRIVECAFAILFALAIVTQVIIPSFRGGTLFPYFRTKQRLRGEISRNREEIEALRVQMELQQLEQKLEREKAALWDQQLQNLREGIDIPANQTKQNKQNQKKERS